MMDSLVGQRYEVRQEIGRGGFGQVCKGYDHERGRKVAIKLEKVDEFEGEVSYLKREEEVYSKLKGEESFGIANIHQFGADLIHDDSDDGLDDNGYILHYMVMDLLGPDLEELLTECSEQFSLKTVLLLADQMIRIIQYVHSKDYIHGDIKPTNFVLGRGKKGSNMIYMVDFGLAQRYRDSQTKEHIAYSDTASYAGTTMFTSLNCHQCIQKSRRDDLESLGYVLVYFLCGSLPWQDIKDWNDKSEKRQLVYEKKASISIEELCTGLPCEFVKYMEYCRSLEFDQEPDYDYLRELFHDLYDQAGFTDVIEYDWTRHYCEDAFAESRLKYHFKSDQQSSKMTPQDIFFYLNVSYKPITERNSSPETIEECLEHVLKFAARDKDQLYYDKDFKWNGMFMSEIVKHYIENDEDIAWIYKRDDLDWKTATRREILKKKTFFAHFDELIKRPGLFFIESAFGVHRKKNEFQHKVQSMDKTTVREKSERVKRFFDSVAIIVSPQSFMTNGSCEETLNFYISEEEISDASTFLDSRYITVAVKPDGVFTYPPKTLPTYYTFDPMWNMVLEIYGPGKESILKKPDNKGYDVHDSTQNPLESPLFQATGSNDSRQNPLESRPFQATGTIDSTQNPLESRPFQATGTNDSIQNPLESPLFQATGSNEPLIQSCSSEADNVSSSVIGPPAAKPSAEYSDFSSPSSSGVLKPIRKPDFIADQSYRNTVAEYIQKSLPSNCQNHVFTMKKMAGQHVLQLLTQFKRAMIGKYLEDADKTTIRSCIGMFVVNEFIYFSRLDVSPLVYMAVFGGSENVTLRKYKTEILEENGPPEVSYSNFCFDITKKNHRFALLLFLKVYMYPKLLDGYETDVEYEQFLQKFEMNV